MRLVLAAIAALCIGAAGLQNVWADKPGRFDYWVLALSWSPQFCRTQPSSEQCELARGFVVHGLWPQYEQGYPEYCGERERVPKDLVERMRPLMPSTSLVNAQWRKHGTCSGLGMREYFLNVERAWRSIVIPEIYRELPDLERTHVRTIEDEFIALTPKLGRDAIAVQCSGRWLREVRICLDRDFQPRACGEDVDDLCRSDVQLRPIRGRQPRTPR